MLADCRAATWPSNSTPRCSPISNAGTCARTFPEVSRNGESSKCLSTAVKQAGEVYSPNGKKSQGSKQATLLITAQVPPPVWDFLHRLTERKDVHKL
jgi:hypothetical protein